MERCNVFFTFILVTTWAYALEPVKYGQDHQEDAYKPETGKPDYYPFIESGVTNPIINYMADLKRYHVHSNTGAAPKQDVPFLASALEAISIPHQSLPIHYYRRTTAGQTAAIIQVLLKRGQTIGEVISAVCSIIGFKPTGGNATGDAETKTVFLLIPLVLAPILVLSIPVLIVCPFV